VPFTCCILGIQKHSRLRKRVIDLIRKLNLCTAWTTTAAAANDFTVFTIRIRFWPKHSRFVSPSLSFCAPTQIAGSLTRYWPAPPHRNAAAKPAFHKRTTRWRCDVAARFWPLRAAIALGAVAFDNRGSNNTKENLTKNSNGLFTKQSIIHTIYLHS